MRNRHPPKHEKPLHNRIISKSQKDLHAGAKAMSRVMDILDSKPDTKLTWRFTELLGTQDVHNYKPPVVEWFGSWQMPDRYKNTTTVYRYLNPNHPNVSRYSDCVVQCACGAWISYGYRGSEGSDQEGSQHTDDCKPWWRYEAHSQYSRKRLETIRQMVRMGFKAPMISKRVGVDRNSLGSIMAQNNETIREYRDEFRRRAGNTYFVLVHGWGVSAQEVADVYGYSVTTLGRWIRKYSDYESNNRSNEKVEVNV